jgi:hypothetical protein
MTLREAVDLIQRKCDGETAYRNDHDLGPSGFLVALKLVLDAARDRLEDTAEIPLPTGGK